MTARRLSDPGTPADGAEVLGEVESMLLRYVAFPGLAEGIAVTLWIAHAHAADAFESTPRLALLSPEPGSGKSRTLEVIDRLVPNPMFALSPSPAAVFRTIGAFDPPPVLLFDEVDTIFGKRRGDSDGNEDLRGVLNAGHRRGAQIPRCVGPRQEVQFFPVFAPAAMAGLGRLPETLMHRSVIIRMKPRKPDQQITAFRHRDAETAAQPVRDLLAAWISQVRDELENARPEMPDGVTDRPADVWEPLLAVADAAGGPWADAARAACAELTSASSAREASLGIRLLTDIRTVMRNEATIHTADLLAVLHRLDEAPWGSMRGEQLAPRGLARLLEPYGIRSTQVKISGVNQRGYRREDFHDAWVRYGIPEHERGDEGAVDPFPASPVPEESATSATSVTPQVSGPDAVADSARVADASATGAGSATAYAPSDLHGNAGSGGNGLAGDGAATEPGPEEGERDALLADVADPLPNGSLANGSAFAESVTDVSDGQSQEALRAVVVKAPQQPGAKQRQGLIDWLARYPGPHPVVLETPDGRAEVLPVRSSLTPDDRLGDCELRWAVVPAPASDGSPRQLGQ